MSKAAEGKGCCKTLRGRQVTFRTGGTHWMVDSGLGKVFLERATLSWWPSPPESPLCVLTYSSPLMSPKVWLIPIPTL